MNELGPGSISFFVPCLDEEGNVGRVIDDVVEMMKEIKRPYEFIVFDDGSTDGTAGEVMERMKKYSDIRIELVRNKYTRGLGRNYMVASYMARGEYFRTAFGDGEEDPVAYKNVLKHIGEADAIASYLGDDDPRPMFRQVVSRLYTFLVNKLSGHTLHYYNASIIHRTQNVRWHSPTTMGFGYQAELMCRLMDEGGTVKEVLFTGRNRSAGKPKVFRLRNVISVMGSLFRIFSRRLQNISKS